MAAILVSLVAAFLTVFVEDAEAYYGYGYYYYSYYYGPSIGSTVGGSIGGLVMFGVLIAVCCICARRRSRSPGQVVYASPAQAGVVVAQAGVTGQPFQPVQGYYPQYPQYPQPQYPQGYAQPPAPFGSHGSIPQKTADPPPPYSIATQYPEASAPSGLSTASPY